MSKIKNNKILNRENLEKIAEELIWYGGKSADGRWEIFIGVDFDYTMTCKGSWTTGKFIENPGCFEVLDAWAKEFNCKYVLDTMRSGERANEAAAWCSEHGLELIGINRNPYQSTDYGETRKTWCAYSIDDHNLGCPLIYPEDGGRPYVDWIEVDKQMREILQPLSELLNEMEESVLAVKADVSNGGHYH